MSPAGRCDALRMEPETESETDTETETETESETGSARAVRAPAATAADLVDEARARELIDQATRVVVLTGAGISTDSGIPDFRGPNGVWTKDPGAERLATLEVYVGDPEVRRRAWRSRLENTRAEIVPNAGHRALVDLEHRGKLDTLVTQNIDGLHQAAGSDPTKVVEIHGSIRDVVCLSCGHRDPVEVALARVRAGDPDPACAARLADGSVCGGILKSATISFGQQLVAADLLRAESAALHCDLLLAVGTTLGVYPAAGMVPLAWRSGAPIIIVNRDPTPFDDQAEVVLRRSIGESLPAIVAP